MGILNTRDLELDLHLYMKEKANICYSNRDRDVGMLAIDIGMLFRSCGGLEGLENMVGIGDLGF